MFSAIRFNNNNNDNNNNDNNNNDNNNNDNNNDNNNNNNNNNDLMVFHRVALLNHNAKNTKNKDYKYIYKFRKNYKWIKML